jgi:hypothetical protein
MRNNIYTLLLLTGFAVNLHAQRRDNIIKLGLIEPYYATLGIAYERFIPETTISIQLSGALTQRNVTIWENLKPTLKGFGGELQGRYYFASKNRKTVSGIYNGVFGKYAQNKISMVVPEGVVNFLDGNSKVFGVFIGYQQGFHNRVFVDITLGSGYHKADYSGRFSDKGRVIPSLISSGFVPKFDIKAGIAF